MNSKSDVNRRVLAIQAKKKRHKGHKKRGKQQTNSGAGMGSVPHSSDAAQMNNNLDNIEICGGSNLAKPNMSLKAITTAGSQPSNAVNKTSAKVESVKLLTNENNPAHFMYDEALDLQEKTVLEKESGKASKPVTQHCPQNIQNSIFKNRQQDDDENGDLDLDVDEDDDDNELTEAGMDDNLSLNNISMNVVDKPLPDPYLGTPSNESDEDEDGEEESEVNSENEEQELKKDYRKGGYHPVNIGDLFQGMNLYSFNIGYQFLN